MTKRVVITGMGVITPIGLNIKDFWTNLLDGVCGVDRIEEFPTDDLPCHVSAEVRDFNPSNWGIESSFIRKQDKFNHFALAAAKEAFEMSGLDASEGGNIDPFRFGVNVSSAIGGYRTIYESCAKMASEGPKWVSPQFIPVMIANSCAGNLAIKFGCKGPSENVATACATSTSAIGNAFRLIKHGYADAMITGGSEAAITPMTVAAFGNMKALTKKTDPLQASLPFSADRDGFVMSEGAGVLILEEYEHAKARGAKIFAEICGFGCTTDAYHATAPRPDGSTQARALSDALSEAGYISGEPLHINSHGTGTILNDSCETAAIKLALGQEAYKAKITANKSQVGHALGAAGGIEAVAAAFTLMEGVVPPTLGLINPDPLCDLDYTPLVKASFDAEIAISNSLAFGGHNACIALRKI